VNTESANHRRFRDPIKLDGRVQDQRDRLKQLSREIEDFPPEVRADVFSRLAAIQADEEGHGRLVIRASVLTGVIAAVVTAAWYERHSSTWIQFWHWLAHGWLHPWVLIIAVGLVGAGAAAVTISGLSPVGKVSGKLVAVAGGISAVAAALFAVYPNLVPATKRSFTIANVTVERGVTLGQYENEAYVTEVLQANASVWKFPSQESSEASAPGIVIDFNLQEEGLRNQSVGLRWVLFDSQTRQIVRQSDRDTDVWCRYNRRLRATLRPPSGRRPAPPTPSTGTEAQMTSTAPNPSPCLDFGGRFRDLDTNSFGLWVGYIPRPLPHVTRSSGMVDASGRPVRCLVARVESYANGEGRLFYADSSPFPGDVASATACASSAAKGSS
jgi:hypothetical protein